jgi:two-component system sensor kinase
LRILGRYVPQTSVTYLLLFAWEALIQCLHTIFPRLFLARSQHKPTDAELLAFRLFSRLAHGYWFVRGKIPCLWTHLRGMNLAERYAPTLELAQAYSEHAPAMSLIPLFRRGIAYAQKSLEIRKEFEDLWGQGQSLHFYGVVLYTASRFSECVTKCREAVRLLERTGDFWEVHIARYQLAASLYRLGDLRGAVKEAQRIHLSGRELGDEQASGISLDVWARASGGDVPAEIVTAEVERPRHDAQGTVQVLLAAGVRSMADGRPDEAVEVFLRAKATAESAGIKNAYVAPVFPWLATALRQQAVTAVHDFTPGRREELLRRAQAAARQGLRIARSFQNDLPHALRESALLAAILGRPRRAKRLFDQSLAVAERQGASYEHAQTLLARGQIGLELGWPEAAHQVSAAQIALRSLRISEPADRPSGAAEGVSLSLADRFDTVLEVGRNIASGLSKKSIFAAVHDAALRLLRAEQCLILDVDETQFGKESPAQTGEPVDSYSQEMVQLATKSGHAVAFDEEMNEATSERVVLHGARSALCAPIFVRHKVVACCYVTHRHIVALFGEDEERLAEFIATIAGAALENAEGFAELQRLNATLEQRVAERTADAEARAKELARSNTELEQFAYVASHDLQEPLRTVASYCQLLQRRYKDQLDADAQQFIAFAVDGAMRMKALISDLLTYSRVGTRGKPFEPTDLANILERAMFNLKVAIEESGVVITHDTLPVVVADGSQLTQLFQNLIGNAIKFRGDKRPRVHVGAELQGDHWLFSVRDEGIGIAPEHAERIFLIFQRLHTRQEYAGTGIGLAVCKKTIERHGGRIWVESEPNKGSVFYFTIPVRNTADN